METKYKNIFWVIYIAFVVVITVLCVMMYHVATLKRTVNEQQQTINQLQSNLYELQTNMEGYMDNYIALWTTLNNAIAGEPEDK